VNADLEALYRAWEAFLEDGQSETRWAIFLSRIEDSSDKYGVSKEKLIQAIQSRYPAWSRANEQKQTSLPKKT
jgi:hypothetical protein